MSKKTAVLLVDSTRLYDLASRYNQANGFHVGSDLEAAKPDYAGLRTAVVEGIGQEIGDSILMLTHDSRHPAQSGFIRAVEKCGYEAMAVAFDSRPKSAAPLSVMITLMLGNMIVENDHIVVVSNDIYLVPALTQIAKDYSAKEIRRDITLAFPRSGMGKVWDRALPAFDSTPDSNLHYVNLDDNVQDFMRITASCLARGGPLQTTSHEDVDNIDNTTEIASA